MTLLKCGLQWQIELFTSAQHISLVFLTLPACVTLALCSHLIMECPAALLTSDDVLHTAFP